MLKKIKKKIGFDDIREILDSQKNIIIIINQNNIVDANKSFFEFFGFKDIEELQQKYQNIGEFLKSYDCIESKKRIDDILNNCNTDHKIKIIKDNKEYIFKVEASKLKNKSILTLTDITELFERKKELKEVNEILNQYKKAADELLIVSKTDAKGVITYVNKNFCDISGYSKEELIGKPHNIIRHPDMPKKIFKDMWETIEKGDIWRGIIKNLRKDGSSYWVDAGIMPIKKTHTGEIIEYIALRTDITEVVKAKEKAQEAEKSKSIFLANMSHEIRTPLNAILGFTQLLEKNKNLDNEVKKYVRIINSSANTLFKVINDILDISKIETGNISIEKKEFNPKKVFTDIFSLFLARTKEKNIIYKIKIDDLPECIVSDEHRLKQVLANLIGNAIKFTPENGKITAGIKVVEENNKKIKLKFSVKDSGIGISKENQKAIFKAFNQADGSITRKYGGTGLGLTISSKIVKKLGGNIEVKSEENKGSEFYFTLEFEKCNKKEKIKKEYKDFSHRAKILVAEDDTFNQELIKAVLEEWDIECSVVSNGREAVKNVKNNNYDLIFLDINMPEMSGVEAVKEIKKITKTPPVIAMTANVFKEDVEKYLQAGFDGYIAKPIKLEELQKLFKKYSKNEKLEDNIDEEDYISFLQKVLKINKDVVINLINIYFSNITEDLKNLQNAVENKNFENIIRFSHKIKGSSINLRLDEIVKLAGEIETNAKNKNINFDYESYFNDIKKSIKNLKQEIDYENNTF